MVVPPIFLSYIFLSPGPDGRNDDQGRLARVNSPDTGTVTDHLIVGKKLENC